MHVHSDYIKSLSKKLQAEVEVGNLWGVYDQNMHHSESKEIQFFTHLTDAKVYCRDNIEDHSQFKLVNIETLLECLQGLLYSDMLRNDIDYYIIYDSTFDVSRVLKENPDQNPLLNPDGNEFTETYISFMEEPRNDTLNDFQKNQSSRTYKSQTLNVDDLIPKLRNSRDKGLTL